MRFFQGRMLYPRSHRRAGQPHPFLYANRGPRTFAHKYFGTQPTGYARGVAGAGGRPIIHAARSAMRPQRGNFYTGRRLTKGGHQSLRDMRTARIEYRKQRAADRLEIREINKIRKKLRAQNWGPDDRDRQRKLAKFNDSRRAVMAKRRESRKAYRASQRKLATSGPMYAGVQKGWFGGRRRFTGWRPTGRYRRRYTPYAGMRMHRYGQRYA
jgi:hypothetical protein